mmetsp:Transcript_24535/g.77138  ORF Transcript_24535/g.77138 Transcript_24535/m.77138 type:complete len:249 (-) Transcript_24535:1159-1905(-)
MLGTCPYCCISTSQPKACSHSWALLHAPIAALYVTTSGLGPPHRSDISMTAAFSHRLAFLQALTTALYITRLGESPCSCGVASKATACSHWRLRPHALMQALYVTTSGTSECCHILPRNLSVHSQFSHEWTAALYVTTLGRTLWRRMPPSIPRRYSHRWPSQALKAELYVITFGRSPSCCIAHRSSRARSHKRPFPQALMAALYVMTSGITRCRCMPHSRPKACCQCWAFSHALMAVLNAITAIGNSP